MTEKEWLSCDDPQKMARFCEGQVNSERFRWLAVEWGRRIRHLFEPDNLPWFDAFTAWVAGVGEHPNRLGLSLPFIALDRPFGHTQWGRDCADAIRRDDPMGVAVCAAYSLACFYPMPSQTIDYTKTHRGRSAKRQTSANAWKEGGREAWLAERQVHEDQCKREFCEQFRCVTGNPFRPVALDPRWQSETVVALAKGIYADCAFDRMPILADALEEAGCDDPDVLNHCRGDGPHVRGCWVVDLLLGKE